MHMEQSKGGRELVVHHFICFVQFHPTKNKSEMTLHSTLLFISWNKITMARVGIRHQSLHKLILWQLQTTHNAKLWRGSV